MTLFCISFTVVLEDMAFFPMNFLPPYYSGTTLTLSCTALVFQVVDKDIDVVINFSYNQNGMSIDNDPRVTVNDMAKFDLPDSKIMYQSQIVICPLAQNYDIGPWTCNATSSSSNPFIDLVSFPDEFVLNKEAHPGRKVTYVYKYMHMKLN